MGTHAANRFVSIVLVINLIVGPLAIAQQSNSPSSPPSNNPTAVPPQQPASNFGSTLASVLNSTDDLGDYVPCEFTIAQLRNLRPAPVTDALTSYEAEDLKKNIISAALLPSNGSSFADGTGQAFARDIGSANFNLDGRTRSEALSMVIAKLQGYQAEAVQQKIVEKAGNNPTNPAATKISSLNAPSSANSSVPTDPVSAYAVALSKVDVSEFNSEVAARRLIEESDLWIADFNQRLKGAQQDLQAKQQDADQADQKEQAAKKAADDALKANTATNKSPGMKAESAAGQPPANQQQSADVAAKAAAAKEAADQATVAKAAADQAAVEVKVKQDSVPQLAANSAEVKKAAQQSVQDQSKSGQAIVDSVRNAIATATRPPDVGCAMAILSWREVQYAFGRLVANEYIGVQVVVRNLNASKQFLIHDAELAVNSNLNNRLGRFYSGRDQKIVRQLSVAQQAFSIRNLVVNIAGGIGILANAAMPFAGPSFKDATGVYNSGFLTALGKAWPDHSTDQLNLLNDVGFSASTDSKAILVPKSGAAMFVMFVPSKPFEEGWWTQDCAQKLLNAKKTPSSTATGSSGIDIDMALDVCGQVSTPPNRKKYSDWSSTADAIFRELAFTVVAGTHIAEESTTAPTVASMDCPKDTQGNLDFTKQANGSINCALTGTNLDKVAKLKLRDAGDATDNATADGSVIVSGDSTKANVDLPLAQVGPLQKPDYKVYAVAKDGTEYDAKQTLHFDINTPYFRDVTPTTTNLTAPATGAKVQPTSITLTGYHLDKIGKQDKMRLSDTSTSAPPDFSFGTTSSPSSATFNIGPGKTSVTGDVKLQLFYVPSGKDAKPLGLYITVSGTKPDIPPAAGK